MSVIPFQCAIGDAPTASIVAAPTTNLGAVDTNTITLTGNGLLAAAFTDGLGHFHPAVYLTITSFGPRDTTVDELAALTFSVTKTVKYSSTYLLHNSATIVTLTNADRLTVAGAVGKWQADSSNPTIWKELSYTLVGAADLETRLAALETAFAAYVGTHP